MPEQSEEFVVADGVGVVGDLDGFIVSLMISLVGGVFQLAAIKAGYHVNHTFYVLVVGLHAPEATTGKNRFGIFCMRDHGKAGED